MEEEVPFDLMEDIFCRLPVKSLVRFKGGCRRWLLLIKDPKFIKLHTQRSSQSHRRGSLIRVVDDNQICSLDLDTLHITKESDHFPLSESFPSHSNSNSIIRTVGACNGLLCLSTGSGNSNDTMMLWNMSTKEHKILPPLPEEYASGNLWIKLDGFGYDPCDDDYKVVRVYYCSTRGQYLAISYSLKLNSWGNNYKPNFPQGHEFLEPMAGVYAGGALHWSAHHYINHVLLDTIIGLDLNKPKLRHFSKISVLQGKFCVTGQRHVRCSGAPSKRPVKRCTKRSLNKPKLRHFSKFSVLQGKLCVTGQRHVRHYWEEEVIDVWVMEEYGKEESWTKLFSFPPYIIKVGGCTSTSYVFKPLTYYHCGNNGDQVLLLLLHGSKGEKVLSYNFNEEEFSYHACIPYRKPSYFYEAQICHQSLVPINHD